MSFHNLFAHWSNKANSLLGIFTADGSNDLVSWIKSMRLSGTIRVNTGVFSAQNLPPVGGYWEGYLHYVSPENIVVTLYDIWGNAAYFGVYTESVFRGWKQLSTAEPPQRFAISFASGWLNTTDSYFYKNQFGEVTIRAESTKDSAVDPLGTLFVLPEGYRPPRIIQFAITFSSPFATVIVMVEPNGRVSTRSGVTEAMRSYFMNITFAI